MITNAVLQLKRKVDLIATACCFKLRWGWDEGFVNANQCYQKIMPFSICIHQHSRKSSKLSQNVQVCICDMYNDLISKLHKICHSYHC